MHFLKRHLLQKQNLRQFAKKSIHIDLTAVWNPRDFVSIPSQNSNKPQPILMDMTNLNYIGKENKKTIKKEKFKKWKKNKKKKEH